MAKKQHKKSQQPPKKNTTPQGEHSTYSDSSAPTENTPRSKEERKKQKKELRRKLKFLGIVFFDVVIALLFFVYWATLSFFVDDRVGGTKICDAIAMVSLILLVFFRLTRPFLMKKRKRNDGFSATMTCASLEFLLLSGLGMLWSDWGVVPMVMGFVLFVLVLREERKHSTM